MLTTTNDLFNNFLKICHVNAQSIADSSHLFVIKNLLYNKCIDVLAVSETWLKSDDSDDYVKVEGYSIIRKDRNGKRGGGVCLFIRKALSFNILYMSNLQFDNQPEYIFIEIIVKKIKLLCSVVYRRPRGESLQSYLNTLASFLPLYDQCCILGDINININIDNASKRNLVTWLNDLNLSILPIFNTHHSTFSSTTIDIIVVPTNIVPMSYGKLCVPGLSNHDLLYVVYPLEVPDKIERKIQYRDYKNVSVPELLMAADKITWTDVLCYINIDSKVEAFNEYVLKLWNDLCPIKETTIKSGVSPWINGSIVKVIKLRNKAHSRWNLFKTRINWDNYVKLKKKVKQMVKCSIRRKLYKATDSKHVNSKQLWQNLRKFGLVKSDSAVELCVPIDELLNHFTIQTQLSSPLVSATIVYYNNTSLFQGDKFYFKYVHSLDILNAVKNVKSNAVGNDLVAIGMIKPILNQIMPVLSHLFNYCLQYSCFPEMWKRAVIFPIPKVSKPVNAKDYRPISLLPVIAKILEKLVFDQIIEYINKYNILDPLQSGFRKLHSTGTALLRIVEDIRLGLSRNEITVLVLFDFSKAFDCVNHEILISKLRHINFSPSALNWIECYLKNRYHCVKDTRNNISDWKLLTCGVPQGSVLGPLLYSLYTFDIGTCFKYCKYHVYADDLQIYIQCKPSEISDVIEKINADIVRLVNWTDKHGLTLNSGKTQAIVISNNGNFCTNNINKIVVKDSPVEYSKKVKNLGIIIDNALSWSPYVSTICQKTYYTLHRLYKFRSLTPIATRKNLVNSLILPIFDYCLYVCCNMNNDCISRLQVAMNSAVRYIYNIKRREHITPYYVKLGWLKIAARRDLQICVMAHKILQGYAPSYLNNLFTVMRDVHSRSTRAHNLYLLAPLPGKGIHSKSFSVLAYRLWNSLGPDLCSIKLTALFKSKIQSKLLSSYSH
jgi:hypothetical protein